MKIKTQQTISPIDGTIYAVRELASNEQIEIALAKSVIAQREWKNISVAERVKICRQMLAYLVEHADKIGEELTWQIGRPIAYSPFEIRRGFAERMNYLCDIAEQALSDLAIEPKEIFSVSFATNRLTHHLI